MISRTQLPFIKNLQSKSPQSDTKHFTRKRPKKEILYRKSPETNKINSHFVTNHSSNSDSDSDSVIDSAIVSNLNNSTKRLKTNKVGKKMSYSPPIKEEIKSEPMDTSPLADSQLHLNISNSSSEKISPAIQYGTATLSNNYSKISHIKMEDLDAIDIMNTPIELDSSDIDIMSLNIKPELMQDTHASYFSLVRDIICSTNEHRMNMYTLQERLKAWQENPISPLNDWYK